MNLYSKILIPCSLERKTSKQTNLICMYIDVQKQKLRFLFYSLLTIIVTLKMEDHFLFLNRNSIDAHN